MISMTRSAVASRGLSIRFAPLLAIAAAAMLLAECDPGHAAGEDGRFSAGGVAPIAAGTTPGR